MRRGARFQLVMCRVPRRTPIVLAPTAAALAVIAGGAFAATGGLTPAGCTAEPSHNPDHCAKTARGLDGANGVAVSADGKSVYATGSLANAIVVFKRNTTTGALTTTGCIADPANDPDHCAKTAKGLDGVSGVVVSADGKSVYATGPHDNAIVVFKRNTTTGALTPAGCIADPSHNPDHCAKTAKGLKSAGGVRVSADGSSVYTTGFLANAIVVFKRNATTGALTPAGCVADPAHNPDHCGKTAKGLDGASGVEVSAAGNSVYAAGSGDNAIVAFKRSTTTGALTPAGCIADASHNPDHCAKIAKGLANPIGVEGSADGKSVYATGFITNAVVVFKRNPATGALTPAGCIADPVHNLDHCAKTAKGLDGADLVRVSADGRSVYATGEIDNAVVVFKRNATTGALTTAGCIADPAHNPDHCGKTAKGLDGASGVRVSADGRSVYVTGFSDNAIVAFKRGL
jgi:6-phosphogluconolactonase (cycloisomerase 2 family)